MIGELNTALPPSLAACTELVNQGLLQMGPRFDLCVKYGLQIPGTHQDVYYKLRTMAEQQGRVDRGEIPQEEHDDAGTPMWIWVVGGAVLIGGAIVLFRRR